MPSIGPASGGARTGDCARRSGVGRRTEASHSAHWLGVKTAPINPPARPANPAILAGRRYWPARMDARQAFPLWRQHEPEPLVLEGGDLASPDARGFIEAGYRLAYANGRRLL
jgi:hypothetical protein